MQPTLVRELAFLGAKRSSFLPPFFCLVVDVLPDVPIEVVSLGSLLNLMNFRRQALDMIGHRVYLQVLGDFRQVLHIDGGDRDGRLGDGGGHRHHGGVRRGTAIPLCQLDFPRKTGGLTHYGAAAHRHASLFCLSRA